MADEHGLKIDEKHIKYELSDEFEEGKIMEQKPGANQYVKKNKKITLVISKGATEGDIEVISVLGEQYTDAVKKLEALGLKVKKLAREDADAEIGEVVAQSPKKGVKVTENTVVELYVCTSHPEDSHEQVPGVIGMTKSQAESALKKQGFALGNVKKESSDKPEGEIIRQEPTAGSESPKGTYVNIVISSGKNDTQTETPTTSKEPTTNNSTTQPSTNTQTPSSNSNSENSGDNVQPQTKTITIPLPEDGDDTIQVRVLANGKDIYNKKHQKSDGKVDIPVKSKKDANIQVYFGDKLVVEKVVEFN